MASPLFQFDENALVRAILRDAGTSWPSSAGAVQEGRFLETAHTLGVLPLIAARITSDSTGTWPPSLRAKAASSLLSTAIVEELRRAELVRVLGRLERAGVRALVFKGGALAYSHYPDPGLRPRRDTDLLIRLDDALAVRDVLTSLGYEAPNFVTSEELIHQFQYVRTDAHGVQHALDVHWKISNVRVFAEMLAFDELWQEGVTIERLGTRVPSPAHALLIACIHRVAHHNEGGDLVWVYDIHLLAEGLTEGQRAEGSCEGQRAEGSCEGQRAEGPSEGQRAEGRGQREGRPPSPRLRRSAEASSKGGRSRGEGTWAAFVCLAAERQVAAVCAQNLIAAQEMFATCVPDEVLRALRLAGDEPSRAFLGGDQRQLDILRSDFRNLRGWQARAAFVRAHVFPPADFVRRSYNVKAAWMLPWYYVHRVVRGLWRARQRL